MSMKKYQQGGTTNPIEQQLESLGLGGGGQFSPEDIMQAIGGTYGLDASAMQKLNPAMFGPIGQQQMAMSDQAY